MAKSKPARTQNKPRFPLWMHSASGLWAKKIRGRVYYFGSDREAALREYVQVRADLEAGRPRRSWGVAGGDGVTLLDLCNQFAAHKKHQARIGELSQRSLADYLASCQRLLTHFGKGILVDQIHPSDLLEYRRALADKCGVHALGNEVTRARVILRFAFEAGLIQHPVRFGEFKRPKKSAFRRSREQIGERMFEPAELRTIIDAASLHLKAMILLGLNAGFGNADCGTLPISAIDFETGWLTFPRPKTGIARRAKLWPVTVETLTKSMDLRTEPRDPDHGHLFFITKYGRPWHQDDGKRDSALTSEFRKLLDSLELYRRGRSFYTLRHVFQTIADETGDETAIRVVMGHADHSMSATYRERFPDARLERVAEHVRAWLFGKKPGAQP